MLDVFMNNNFITAVLYATIYLCIVLKMQISELVVNHQQAGASIQVE